METLKIYALLCPNTYEIRYIGRTKLSLERRLIAHISEDMFHNASKSYWIRCLKEKGLLPIITLLEETNDLKDKKIEKIWVQKCLDEKCNLLNINS